MADIAVLWDESHLWGLLALRALRAWAVPHRLVRATEIAQGLLSRKPPAGLLVPGGFARGKAARLGGPGIAAVQEYVRGGGWYLGFCGGSGLGLSGGLSLCPWERRGFSDRMQHFVSGHVRVELARGHDLAPEALDREALVPVWWPAQFAARGEGVTALGAYLGPGPDFWVADLSLAGLSEEILSEWEGLYGITLRPDFLKGRPCVAAGFFGSGRYVLSYPHLETPASPQANLWLSHILARVLGEGEVVRPPLPAWDLAATPAVWPDPVLVQARAALEEIIETGREHWLLFWRNPWLLGWRRGIPGAGVNSLYALVCETMARPENEAAAGWWRERSGPFAERMEGFRRRATGYLLAERIAMSVAHLDQDGAFPLYLREQREALFGLPPAGGGLYGELSRDLEELAWRALC